MSFVYFRAVILFFLRQDLVCSSGWPGIHCVTQLASVSLSPVSLSPCLSLSKAGLQAPLFTECDLVFAACTGLALQLLAGFFTE